MPTPFQPCCCLLLIPVDVFRSQYFAKRDEILAYFNDVADQYDVRKHMRFETELLGARWDHTASRWQVGGRTSCVPRPRIGYSPLRAGAY